MGKERNKWNAVHLKQHYYVKRVYTKLIQSITCPLEIACLLSLIIAATVRAAVHHFSGRTSLFESRAINVLKTESHRLSDEWSKILRWCNWTTKAYWEKSKCASWGIHDYFAFQCISSLISLSCHGIVWPIHWAVKTVIHIFMACIPSNSVSKTTFDPTINVTTFESHQQTQNNLGYHYDCACSEINGDDPHPVVHHPEYHAQTLSTPR